MPRLFACLLALSLLTLPALAAPKIGASAPAFSSTDTRGRPVSLKDFQGRYVVLEWTNHECPFVQKHYGSGSMQALQKHARTKDVVWLSVISSAPGQQGHVDGPTAEALSQDRGAAPAAILLDAAGTLGRQYDAKTTPHLFLIDPQGRLLYMGGIDSIASADPDDIPKATPYLKLALEQALAGKPVEHPVTRPYGCSVKY